jgi:hypothetical protein
MCPGTLALVGVGLSAAGTLGSGIAAGGAAGYQAQVAKNNAQIAAQNELHAAQAGAVQTENAGLKARSQLANVRAAIGANNLDVNSGSAADVQQSQRELGFLDTATVANNAAQEVYGYGAQKESFQAQANLLDTESVLDPIGGVVGAAGTLLSNPSFDNLIGGGGAGGGAGDVGAQTFEPGATGPPQSLMSGNPDVPPQYAWMQTNDELGGTGEIY